MTAKRCPKCGCTNPRYFTHCVECGARLEDVVKRPGKTLTYLKYGIVLCATIILIVFVALPLYEHSLAIGKNASAAISAGQDAPLRTESAVGRPVGNNNLRITVGSARDGDNTFNSNKFHIVIVSLKNVRDSGNVQVTSNDFTLIDSGGNSYSPYGIGSKVMYELAPSQEVSGAELTFLIPQNVTAKELQFTFPGTSALAGNRPVVAFLL
jgi:hypothetical protein